MINTVIKLEYLPIETNIYKIVVINVTILIIIPSIVFSLWFLLRARKNIIVPLII